jgi:acetyl-CoA carboxylase beta subunit
MDDILKYNQKKQQLIEKEQKKTQQKKWVVGSEAEIDIQKVDELF